MNVTATTRLERARALASRVAGFVSRLGPRNSTMGGVEGAPAAGGSGDEDEDEQPVVTASSMTRAAKRVRLGGTTVITR